MSDHTSAHETPLWHPFADMHETRRGETVFVRGEGAYVWDSAGRSFFDAPASLWYCNVGHGREEIAQAMARQATRLEAYSNFGTFATEPTIELAARLVGLAPMADAKIFFTSGGSDAVDTAAKLARRYWNALDQPQKTVIVSRRGSYHGMHGYGTSLAGIDANRAGYGPLVADTVVVDRDDPAALEETVTHIGPKRVAAFFAEPIIGAGGIHFPKDDYLRRAADICRRHDILFVADEVITGFGRAGELFASTRFGIQPDMLLVAKGLTSGYAPLGAVFIAPRVSEPFWNGRRHPSETFRHGVTYSGHAVACAAALANLDILEREDLVARARRLEVVLSDMLEPLRSLDAVADVRSGPGFLAGIDLVAESTAADVVRACFERGHIVRLLTGGTLQLSPPFVSDDSDITALGIALSEAISHVASTSYTEPSVR